MDSAGPGRPVPKNEGPSGGPRLRRQARYILCGCLAAGLDFFAFTLLTATGLAGAGPANAISICLGIVTSYLLNRAWTFGVRDHAAMRLVAFVGVGLLGLLVSDLVIAVLTQRAALPAPLAKALSIPVVFVVQYNLNRLITFRTPIA